jgi:DNA-binding response OmpR family regulator
MSHAILIVDDSLTVRMDLADAFTAAGMLPRPCATAAEARETLARGAVALVILDVLLPDADGVELLKELRALPAMAGVPILMLSSEAEVKDRVRGLQTGADEYVGKPYEIGYVVARARELIAAAQPARVSVSGTAVLVIDDSPTFREVLRSALVQAGYPVLLAATGEEGLRLAAGQRPSAILVDGMLPGIDGATVIRRVRLDAALRGVPCVLLTASEDVDSELRALDAGADTFVRKDDDIEVILARLTAVLRQGGLAPTDGAASLLGPKKILAVDDSATYLQALASILLTEGYDVILAHSGEEALDLLAVQVVDCILLDLQMPGLSGQETCRRVKAAPHLRDIPLIMLTAREDREAMIEGLGAGADDYIAKSSEFEVLKARVRAQIRRKQFEDEHRRMREELLRKELEAAEVRAARELAETRAVLVEELERKNKELEAFSYSVSHDLRAPLRAIDGFSRALQGEYGATLDQQAGHYLERVRAGTRHMTALIDDMLNLSRVTRANLRKEPVKLSESARRIAATLAERNPARQVAVEIDDDLDALGDGHLLDIVLENLLGNAWKFTSKQPQARISLTRERQGDENVFRVRDNGAGFDMTYAAKLFTPFQRLHRATDFEGTGIGLAIVQRIISRHGGRVWAESELGHGATFSFTLGADP